jgi:ACT domain-containing protein
MKAIVTVIGKDRVGITASVCALLAQHNINILDISQTVLQEFFTMVMLVDTAACTASIGEMADLLSKAGEEQGLSIRIQREDIFNAMHRI